MKILHVASFSGNIGDNASHMGLRKVLSLLVKCPEITELEIRDFYKNAGLKDKKYFDQSYVKLCNEFDLIIWGGGGYLDYWVPNSSTGTTFDITIDVMNQINPPTLITSVGCVPGKPVPEGNKAKFNDFLAYIASSNNFHLMLRNDGSFKHIKENFSKSLAEAFSVILDNAFHYEYEPSAGLPLTRDYVAMNIAYDQILMTGESAAILAEDDYYQEIVKIVNYIIVDCKLDVCFIPHISADIKAIDRVISKLSDKYVRKNILIAPYMSGNAGANYNFGIYKNSVLSIGNRFHANVCGISLGVKTIGLAALDRITQLYSSLDLLDSCVTVDHGFSKDVIHKISQNIGINSSNSSNSLSKKLNKLKSNSISEYKDILTTFFK
ncbi:polysaccharide pyruvyl transferase family protein [Methylophilaceae bacterium]|nr:polysaccharide pyruvyl transferase family protein [Methylophilaceae bacterium]